MALLTDHSRRRSPILLNDRGAEQRVDRALIWIVVVAATVRFALWVVCANRALHIVDEQHYNTIALNLLEDGVYGHESGIADSHRPPLYPWFLAALYWAGAEDDFAFVRMTQAAMGLLTIPLAYRLGRLLYDRSVARWSAAITAFYPSLAFYNYLLLTETLFTALLLAFVVLTVRTIETGGRWRSLWAGIACGLATLARSVLWLYPPFVACFLAIAGPGRWTTRLAIAGCWLAGFALVVAPWSARNTAIHDTFVAVDTMGGRNFMMANYENTPRYRIWAVVDTVKGERSWDRVLAAQHENYAELTQGQRDKLAMAHGIRYVLEEPLETALRDVVKFFNFWQLERELVAGAVRSEVGALGVVGVALPVFLSYAAVFSLSLFGLIVWPSSHGRASAFVFLTIAFICAMHTVVFGHSRYHLPLIPLLAPYASSAWVARGEWRQRASSVRFALASLAVLLFAASWAFEIIAVELPKLAPGWGTPVTTD